MIPDWTHLRQARDATLRRDLIDVITRTARHGRRHITRPDQDLLARWPAKRRRSHVSRRQRTHSHSPQSLPCR